MSTVTKNVRPSATFWRVSNILKTPGPFFFLKNHIFMLTSIKEQTKRMFQLSRFNVKVTAGGQRSHTQNIY